MKSTGIIRGLRGKKSLSQEDVALVLGISRQTYNSLENDLLKNDFRLIFKLLEVLDASESEQNDFFDALRQDYKSYTMK